MIHRFLELILETTVLCFPFDLDVSFLALMFNFSKFFLQKLLSFQNLHNPIKWFLVNQSVPYPLLRNQLLVQFSNEFRTVFAIK